VKTVIIQSDPNPPSGYEGRGDPSMPHRRKNLAARMAHWSGHHRKTAIFGWFGLVAVLFAISFVSPMKSIVFETSGPGESGRADTVLYEDFAQPAGESILIQSASLTVSDPEFRATVQAVITAVSPLDSVAKLESPLEAGNEGLVSADKRSALVPLEIRGPPMRRRTRSTPSSPPSQQSRRRTPASTWDRLVRAPARP